MLHQSIGGFPSDGREEFGKFLRHVFPLGLASFEDLALDADEETETSLLEAYARSLGRNERQQ
jgi:hypothetical protein